MSKCISFIVHITAQAQQSWEYTVIYILNVIQLYTELS